MLGILTLFKTEHFQLIKSFKPFKMSEVISVDSQQAEYNSWGAAKTRLNRSGQGKA